MADTCFPSPLKKLTVVVYSPTPHLFQFGYQALSLKLGPGLQKYCYECPLMSSRRPLPDTLFTRVGVKGKIPKHTIEDDPTGFIHNGTNAWGQMLAAKDTTPTLCCTLRDTA